MDIYTIFVTVLICSLGYIYINLYKLSKKISLEDKNILQQHEKNMKIIDEKRTIKEEKEKKENSVIIRYQCNYVKNTFKIKTEDPNELMSEIKKDGYIKYLTKNYIRPADNITITIDSVEPYINNGH
mgnify:CR=1 FL=1